MHVAGSDLAVAQPQMAERADAMSRDDVLARYRTLRNTLKVHNDAAFDFIGEKSRLEHAKRLGLGSGKTIFAESDPEWALITDFALYAAKPGRSRAVDRYARGAQPANEDAACMLTSMCSSVFSVWKVERRHEVVGLILADLLRDHEVRLIDEAMENTVNQGLMFASRLCLIDGFAMTTGVIVPVNDDILDEVLQKAFYWNAPVGQTLLEQTRFATAICRAAVDHGMLDRVVFR